VVERSWVVRPVPVCVVLVCGRTVLGGKAGASVCVVLPVCVWWLVCGRTVLGGKAGASVCVVLACGRAVLGGKAGASVCVVVGVW